MLFIMRRFQRINIDIYFQVDASTALSLSCDISAFVNNFNMNRPVDGDSIFHTKRPQY